MPQNILTHQMIAREAAKMLVEEDTVVKNVNTERKREFGEEVNGYKKGDTVKVGIPPVPVTFDGPVFAGGGAAPDLNESFVNLTLDTQKHVALTFTAKEKLLSLSNFRERFLQPAMQSLRSTMNADLLTRFARATPNLVGTPGTIPNTRRTYGQARAVLNARLAPVTDRSVLYSSDANLELAEANQTLFNDQKQVSEIYKEGSIGVYAGFNFWENQSMPVLANGAGAGYVVNGANQTGSGLVVGTGTGALLRGQIFTLANVFAVHPITGASTGKLRQFVVAADYAGGAGTIQIFPAITPTTAAQIGTVTASPANGVAVTLAGAASTGYRQNLAFQKDAFAAAFAPLPVLAGCEGYTATVKGVSVRVMTGGDFTNDRESTRIDVLYGSAAVRPDHSTRITE